jgi:ribosomal protein S27E
MEEAEIQWITQALAHCPHCNNEHEVPVGDSGETECGFCGETFFWSTVS